MKIKFYSLFLILVLLLAGCSLDESSAPVTENDSPKTEQEQVEPQQVDDEDSAENNKETFE